MKYKGVYQRNANDCGVASLLSLIKYYKGNNTFENIRYLTKCDNNGRILKANFKYIGED